ncbi:MAG: OmpA family protein [Pseudomonadota bacterium]
MNSRVFAAILLGLAGLSSAPAQAQAPIQDPCTQMMIYAVQQFCSLMPNGQSLCQPVALTGPSPACQLPSPPQFKPVPLAPPQVQLRYPVPNTMMPPLAAPGALPFLVPAPFPPQAAPSPYLASPVSPFAAQPISPFSAQPFAPQPSPAQPSQPVPATPVQVQVAPPPPVAGPQAVAAPVSPATKTTVAAPEPADAAPGAAPAVGATTTLAAPTAPAPVTPATPGVDTPPVPAQALRDDTTPEPVAANLPEVPSLPAVVAEAVALFPFDSAELTPLGMETLDSWLASAPVGMPVVVYGYADRLGPESYNQGLSQRRADAARTYLISKGKDKRDIRAEGRGEANPVKHCKGGPTQTTIDCLAPNRRVHIIPE